MRRRKGEKIEESEVKLKEQSLQWKREGADDDEQLASPVSPDLLKNTYSIEPFPPMVRAVSLLSETSLDVFFSRVEIVNQERIPKTGPCILFGNHNNQFVDGMILLRTASK